MTASPVAQEAAFVPGAMGPSFRLVSRPSHGKPIGTVIAVHAFAEEMNKSRRMCARMARMLAQQGWRVVQRDLAGCGDSHGEFADASWQAWVADLEDELSRADQSLSIWLWGVRAGGLLASALLPVHPDLNLLLWQPVASGGQHLQQFLRLHAGARIVGSGKSNGETTPADLLRSGKTAEVGGYDLNPALASGFEKSTFDVPPGFRGRIVWLEITEDSEPELSPASLRVIERLRSRDITIEADAITGPSFWKTLEIEECESLLDRSLAMLASVGPAAPDGSTPLDSNAKAKAAPMEGADPRNADAEGSRPGDDEQALGFDCGQMRLWGILGRAPAGVGEETTAVVIAVGGPQYRVGSHRQFTLLSRMLSRHGFVTLRFDYRGMGDSHGDMQTFEDAGADIHAAIDAVRRACPAVRQVVVWGLCDAASAAMMHAASHPDVSGIVAVNPWARSEASLAAVQVKHYYAERLMQREFWSKLLRGGLDWRASFGSLLSILKRLWMSPRSSGAGTDESFQTRMARGLASFRGQVLLIIAGNDLTAKEFLQFTETSTPWRGLLADSRITRVDVPQADHTFSSRAWREQVENATFAWLQGPGALAPR